MFGGTQSFGAASETQGASTDAKKPRQEDKMTCLPATIRAVETAVAQATGGEILLYGSEPSLLMIVGVVEELARQTASLEFTLNDATGRMKARYFFSGPPPDDVDDFAVGKYVSMVGSIRTAPALHIGVTCMRVVDSADAISYHMIEAAHAALKLQKGSIDQPMPAGMQVSHGEQSKLASEPEPKVTSAEKPPLTSVPTPARDTQRAKLDGPRLREALLGLLQTASETRGPEGLETKEITGHFPGTPAAEVKASLQSLVNEGEVFTTIDDDHFGMP
eukprot:gnl/TRDRNA2_/TRDRNA2_182188_c0_seq1.p1 gnl/TRDRNA2_/TRDRNA2_182188_c0~~gnl/TRDRNA2_/TRDRNA2_182188_c0_seq1.p1  ORF type:complete len:276 (-),score=51.70 gnl/TRDRNA2_/TRDRNA2_182188_c0_seq1:83-910(-)